MFSRGYIDICLSLWGNILLFELNTHGGAGSGSGGIFPFFLSKPPDI